MFKDLKKYFFRLLLIQYLAYLYRMFFKIDVIGITGTNGKTTTKDMISHILACSLNVISTYGNDNGQSGVTYTLLRLRKNHKAAVIEMGTDNFGLMKRLAYMVRPNLMVYTNIGESHLELLKDKKGILEEKLSAIRYMPKNGSVIVNSDDKLLFEAIKNKNVKIFTYGRDSMADICASDIEQIGDRGLYFNTVINERKERFYIPIIGIHNVYNALAAISVALVLGIDIEVIKKQLMTFSPPRGRMELFKASNECRILDDSFKADFTSTVNAIKALDFHFKNTRKIIVLGDMVQLGNDSANYHREVGKIVASSGIYALITVGSLAKDIAREAIANGMPRDNVYSFDTKRDAIRTLRGIISPKDTILIQASNILGFHEIRDALLSFLNSKEIERNMHEFNGLRKKERLSKSAYDSLKKANNALGVNIENFIVSAYRDFDEQEEIKKEKRPLFKLIRSYYSFRYIDYKIAEPRSSSHCFGVSIDIDCQGLCKKVMEIKKVKSIFLADRAICTTLRRSGFIQDIKSEPWHFTYEKNPL